MERAKQKAIGEANAQPRPTRRAWLQAGLAPRTSAEFGVRLTLTQTEGVREICTAQRPSGQAHEVPRRRRGGKLQMGGTQELRAEEWAKLDSKYTSNHGRTGRAEKVSPSQTRTHGGGAYCQRARNLMLNAPSEAHLQKQ